MVSLSRSGLYASRPVRAPRRDEALRRTHGAHAIATVLTDDRDARAAVAMFRTLLDAATTASALLALVPATSPCGMALGSLSDAKAELCAGWQWVPPSEVHVEALVAMGVKV